MSIFKLFPLLTLLLYVTCSSLANAATDNNTGLPDQFTIKYVLIKNPLTLAEMTRKLYSTDNGNYVFESYSKPVGYAKWFTESTLLERSEWTYHNDQLRPLHYSYNRSGGKKKRHVELQFDWKKKNVTNTINNDPWRMAIPDNTLDKLLYHLAVMRDLQLGRKKLSYKIADGGSLKSYDFQILKEEILDTKLGKIKTLKIKLPGRRVTFLWCAIDYNYVPIRIEQGDKRGVLRMEATELSITPTPSETQTTTSLTQSPDIRPEVK